MLRRIKIFNPSNVGLKEGELINGAPSAQDIHVIDMDTNEELYNITCVEFKADVDDICVPVKLTILVDEIVVENMIAEEIKAELPRIDRPTVCDRVVKAPVYTVGNMDPVAIYSFKKKPTLKEWVDELPAKDYDQVIEALQEKKKEMK
jgi:hypothetical protein